MTKKIRLIDEPDGEKTATEVSTADSQQLLKYLEAIDWKLWELLKIAKEVSGSK